MKLKNLPSILHCRPMLTIYFKNKQCSFSAQNWFGDFFGTPISHGNGVTDATVHMGFQQSYKAVQKNLTQVVQQEVKYHLNYTVAITGRRED
ncbi:hypothetical protein INT45_005968 [Circinella minor]|uniref:Fungal lipase-type domain-containing protein n=1 Tax=Circinella minor TaxID=1195481 RepID=A0A8H7VKP3_9FUNG|nr:hypothetical protein INT45_005968 [Circinella minor]